MADNYFDRPQAIERHNNYVERLESLIRNHALDVSEADTAKLTPTETSGLLAIGIIEQNAIGRNEIAFMLAVAIDQAARAINRADTTKGA